MNLDDLKAKGECPQWLTEEGYKTIAKGYLLKQETPKAMYRRIARSAAKSGGLSDDFKHDFFDIMFNRNFMGPSSPVLANLGTDRGLPIACYVIDVADKMEDIMGRGLGELSMLTKNGGGVGVSFQRIRPRGSLIKGGKNGRSEGIIPFGKVYDASILATKQGDTRRGAASINLSIEHGDFSEFIKMRRPEGDINRQCQNLHHCVTISDEFMHKVKNGDPEARHKWAEVMKTRIETGEPYLFFEGNVEKGNPQCYKDNGLDVSATNICCLTGDTLVATKDGPRRIEDIVNVPVYIFDGNVWTLNNTFSKRGETSELYEIEFKSGQKVRTTNNHRWFVSNSYNEIRKNKLKEVVSENLKEGQYVEYHTEEFHGNKVEHGAYLKGFLVGDGSFYKESGVPKLTLHFTKFPCEDKLISSCLEISGDDYMRSDTAKSPSFGKIREYTGTKSYGRQIIKNMKGLSYRKKELTYWTTEAKQSLPSYFTQWNKATKLEFLSGLIDADGTYGTSIQITQSNRKLIEDIQVLVSSLGYSSSIDSGNGRFRLTIGSYDSYELFKQLDCRRVSCNVKKPNRRTTGYRKIKSIKKIKLDNPVPVYCPTVETTGKFALANGLMTGNSEILLHTDPDHSFVCCLSSINLAKYDEWKDWKGTHTGLSLPELAVYFLNAVLDEFIEKAQYIPYMERAVASAVKGRAIGIGALGWHTLLQNKMIPFESFEAMQLNNEVFKTIDELSLKATKKLAEERGEPEWCKGHGIYNTHRIAVAPTRSNSIISGDVSAGIEPIIANAYTDNTAKGTFLRRNKQLQNVLDKYGKNTDDIWKDISNKSGSVQHLDFLSDKEKMVFKTAYEIDQKVIIQQAAQRQKNICQSQSLNLFFPFDVNPKYFNDVHLLAWELGVKTLYYCRSTSGIKVDHTDAECLSCEG